ncbi:hypothetical protein FHX08_001192 [Rhizobium sp. BK529]|uniref:hypothetical protein n=1 Tax=unclassified Rhizobium TaxID=2613769 RepID=UPI00104F10BD|nr:MULTISPECIES: hypothetical protein [unclassified Rhizobium]MBB3590848.1 hypothetical protein [Rhizobium sp. BK529]TCS09197.1 hypothetical protein EV281_1011078 [Rhizobium sp. BK418]
MTIASSLRQCSADIINGFHTLADRHRRRSELWALPPEERQRVADELRLTATQLERLVAAGPKASVEMERLMAALGIEVLKVEAGFPHLMNDFQATCAQCNAKRACRRALADGNAPERMQAFCPNADELFALSERLA